MLYPLLRRVGLLPGAQRRREGSPRNEETQVNTRMATADHDRQG